jgi:hydroxyacylglutathione hydrolase
MGMTADLQVQLIEDEALGNTSYLVPCGQGLAFSVDPRRDVDEHLATAARLGVGIAAVLETHLHADFVSGGFELRRATDADLYAATDARLGFPHRPVGSGDRFEIGDVEVHVIGTPGHTPEHISYLVTNGGSKSVFSGGSLIVGGAARTDLTGSDRTEELARAQYSSLRTLAALPDETTLCPTHGGGSFCSATRARSATSTVGRERATNPLLDVADEATFVERLLAGFGSYPTYFHHLRDVNRSGPKLLADLADATRIPPSDAQRAVERGAWLVDARSTSAWAAAHPAGSVSIELRPAFASWLGWVVPFGAPVVLILEPDQIGDAIRLARRIGYDNVSSWLTFEDWSRAGSPTSSIESIGAEEAAERSRNGPAALLDVRQRAEHAAARLPGALHLELGDIIDGKTPEVSEVITYCGHGERSATAASLLARRGLRVANLAGGIGAWRDAGLPVER